MYLIETEASSWDAVNWPHTYSQESFIVGTDMKTFRFDGETDAKNFSAFLQSENLVYVYHGCVTEH